MSHHLFGAAPSVRAPRSTFRRDFNRKMTFDAGYLVPLLIDEILPGDTLNLSFTAFGRLANPVYPIMDNLYLDTFFFAVPYRLVWDHWEQFNGAQANPGDTVDYLIPHMSPPSGGYPVGSIHDYFTIPTDVSGFSHSSLWHRAYNLIWNEWFRDENLQDSVDVPTDDGPDDPNLYKLLKRGKRHDYFTSCLVSPQKGHAVHLPLGQDAPVVSTGSMHLRDSFTGHVDVMQVSKNDSWPPIRLAGMHPSTDGDPLFYHSGLKTDLSQVTGLTVNQLRQAFQIQKLLEKDARGGTRYPEIIYNHFNVVSPDARLQRPEFLGGSHDMINVNPVPQTSSTDQTSPQGNVSAYATLKHHCKGFTKSFSEHCLLIGLCCVRADLSYQQGLPRMFSRKIREDFYWPTMQGLGEQAVLNKEIYCQGNQVDDDVFGYQERYAEYRYRNNEIVGQFRSTYAQSLDAWHLAQKFGNLPTLSSDFIEENPPVDRIKAVQADYPDLIMDIFYRYRCSRAMPVYSIPGFIDHF